MTDAGAALFRVQERSRRNADPALRTSWPRERTMDAAELEGFLVSYTRA